LVTKPSFASELFVVMFFLLVLMYLFRVSRPKICGRPLHRSRGECDQGAVFR
jgi:hypothetical protein